MEKLQNKINNFVKIHTIPNVILALLDELDNRDSNSASIAKVIKKDISLSAKLLRVANSPFYRRQSDISSIDQAVTILGLKAVKALALSVSMFEVTGGKNSDIIDLAELWRHNLEVSAIAQGMAEKIDGIQPEEAFICGMIHDLGVIFFIQEYEEEYQKVLSLFKSGRSFEESEIEVLGMNHSEAGSRIASAWRLPQVIQESIANHHVMEIYTIPSDKVEIWQIVNLAHRYCRNGVDIGQSVSAEMIEKRHDTARIIGLDTETICQVLATVPDMIIQSASFLDVDIGEPIEILKKANEQLGRIYEEYEEAIIENEYLQAKLIQQERSRAALEALKTTLATFSHYVNNATAAIVGRAQILDLYLTQGKLDDPDGKISHSIKIISESVDTICAVLDELKEFPEFKTIAYHGSSRILDIDKNIKARLGRLA